MCEPFPSGPKLARWAAAVFERLLGFRPDSAGAGAPPSERDEARRRLSGGLRKLSRGSASDQLDDRDRRVVAAAICLLGDPRVAAALAGFHALGVLRGDLVEQLVDQID